MSPPTCSMSPSARLVFMVLQTRRSRARYPACRMGRAALVPARSGDAPTSAGAGLERLKERALTLQALRGCQARALRDTRVVWDMV